MSNSCKVESWVQFLAIGILLVFALFDLVLSYEFVTTWKEKERQRLKAASPRGDSLTASSKAKMQHPYYATTLALFFCVARNLTIAGAVFETWRVGRSSTIRVLVVTGLNCTLFVWVCSCFVLVTRLQLLFDNSAYAVPRKHIDFFYTCIFMQLLFSMGCTLFFGIAGGSDTMIIFRRVIATISIIWLFVELSVLCKANISRLLALVATTTRTRHLSSEIKLSKLDDCGTANENVDENTNDTLDVLPSDKELAVCTPANGTLNASDSVVTATAQKPKSPGFMSEVLTVKNLRRHTLSSFHENDRQLLAVATKQSVLLVASIFCALFTMIGFAIFADASPNSWCITVPFQFASLFIGIGINGLALCVYLSFGSSKNEYKLLCSKCDYWCGKVAALYVTNVLQNAN